VAYQRFRSAAQRRPAGRSDRPGCQQNQPRWTPRPFRQAAVRRSSEARRTLPGPKKAKPADLVVSRGRQLTEPFVFCLRVVPPAERMHDDIAGGEVSGERLDNYSDGVATYASRWRSPAGRTEPSRNNRVTGSIFRNRLRTIT